MSVTCGRSVVFSRHSGFFQCSTIITDVTEIYICIVESGHKHTIYFFFRSINLQLNNGTTPAYLASQFGYLDILKYLVEKGANLNMKSFDGMSCLHAACQGGHLDVVKWLVRNYVK
jgi:hypothetical protein